MHIPAARGLYACGRASGDASQSSPAQVISPADAGEAGPEIEQNSTG